MMVSNEHDVSDRVIVRSPAPRASCLLSNLTVDIVSLSCCPLRLTLICASVHSPSQKYEQSVKVQSDITAELGIADSIIVVVRESISINLCSQIHRHQLLLAAAHSSGKREQRTLIKDPGATNCKQTSLQTDWVLLFLLCILFRDNCHREITQSHFVVQSEYLCCSCYARCQVISQFSRRVLASASC